MAKKRYFTWLIAVSICIVGCGESLEDTYKEYAGDGMVRYIGKCTDMAVVSGWKCIRVNWENSTDPTIKHIKVSWISDNKDEEVLLPKDATSYVIDAANNESYKISVCAVDEKGNTSLPAINYARPYTETHEVAMSFTRGITRYYMVNNNLVLFFDSWNSNIDEFKLDYTDHVTKQPKSMKLTSALMNGKYYILRDVDTSKEITLNRKGKIEGCPDLIEFESIRLVRGRMFTSEFRLLLRSKYGQVEPDDAFIENATQIEVDYNITSLEDILYFPNLKKVTLGKNRFLREDYATIAPTIGSASKFYDKARSIFILDAAYELMGVRVERYNKHYFSEAKTYVTDMGNPVLPALNYIDKSNWVVTTNYVNAEGHDNSHPEYLIDGNLSRAWEPELSTTIRNYELTVNMGKTNLVTGIVINQKRFDPKGDNYSNSMLPGLLRIKISENGLWYEDATFVEENVLGNTNGEATVLRLKEPKNIQRIKLMVYDQVISTTLSGVCIGEINVF